MRAHLCLILAALLLVPAVAASTVGGYAGVGWSERRSAHWVRDCGPTSVALTQVPDGAWTLDIELVKLPQVGCDGLATGFVSFPGGFEPVLLEGSPAEGFTAEGSYETLNPAGTVVWDLTFGAVDGTTAWSIHFFSVQQGSAPRHSWWNGTVSLQGAHA